MREDRKKHNRDIAAEVEEELSLHLRLRAEDNEAAGMEPEEARRAAEQAFGNYRHIARASLYQRTAPRHPSGRSRVGRVAAFAETLGRDVLLAVRGFARQPGFAVTAVVTLALGLGATTATYSLANWALIRPVPGVESPEDLSHVWVGRMMPEGSFSVSMLSIPNFDDVAARMQTTEDLAYYQRSPVTIARDDDGAESMLAAAVSSNYFDLLGIRPALGRGFSVAEGAPGAQATVVVIGHQMWTSAYDSDPDVLGSTLRVNGLEFSIVGVAPQGFEGTELFEGLDLWVPGSANTLLRQSDDPERYADRGKAFFYMLLARRAPGATWEQVSTEFDSLEAWLLEQFPETNEQFAEVGFHVFGSFGVQPMGNDDLRRAITLLFAGSGLVLFIACANVANLLLIRGLGRNADVALRRALGCSRLRLFRHQLTEGAVLWMAGGLLGIGVARLLATLFQGAPVGGYTQISSVPLDMRVLAFSAVVTLVAGLLFAALPGLAAQRIDPASSLKGAAATTGRRRQWLQGSLTAAQIAASLTLLVGAFLLAQTLGNLAAIDHGFDPVGVYTFPVSTFPMSYPQPETFRYFVDFERQLAQRPDIADVAVTNQIPLAWGGMRTRVYPSGEDPETSMVEGRSNLVLSPGYFDLFGIPLVRGRTFRAEEVQPPGEGVATVVIVSETLADRLFGSIDVVGRTLAFPYASRDGKHYEIVGVVGDVHYESIDQLPEPRLYEPVGGERFMGFQYYLSVRANGRTDVAAIAREIGASLDDALPIGEVRSMNDLLADARAHWTLLTKLIVLLAVFAAALSAVGLYGIVAFTVRSRTRELGIRVALGASTHRVFRLVLRTMAGTAFAGLVAGLAGAAALVRLLEGNLYGVAPFDPGTWVAAALGMGAVALAATILPARRATRLDPVETLRIQ